MTVCVGCGVVKVGGVDDLERGGSAWSEAVRPSEVSGEEAERLLDDRAMHGGVGLEALGYRARAARSPANHVYEVVGVLGLATVAEGQCLEHGEGGWAADGYGPRDLLTFQGVAVEIDVDALVEGQLEAGRDQRSEVGL